MRSLHSTFEEWPWIFVFGALWSLALNVALAQKQPAANEPAPAGWATQVEGKVTDYVGDETCATSCHRIRAVLVSKTAHAHIAVAGTKVETNCEACHGPGKAHAEAEKEAEKDRSKSAAAKKLIFAFNSSPQENAARCVACHNASRDHALFNRSEHKLQGVGCQDCHAPHLVVRSEKPERVELALAQQQFFSAPRLTEEVRWLSQSLLREPQPNLCFNCHKAIQAQFALPTHHRVPEGLMKCTDCHNPHGTLTRSLLNRANWETCVSCHTEKRGPYAFEHPSVRVEGCVICHTPHGTVNRNLLLRGEGRFLCLQCHVDPQAVNVPHGRLGFQTSGECVRCHVAIHGSNFSEFFLR